MERAWSAACCLAIVSVVAGMVMSAGSAAARPADIRIVYGPPGDAVQQAMQRNLQDRKTLENIRDRLGDIRLPRVLTIRIAGCQGEVDASYESADATITICYEYLAYLQELARNLPPAAVGEGLTPETYLTGPLLEVVLHELAHALFDLKKIPILGREEDAADQVAAFTLMRLDRDEARRAVAAIAVMYASEAKSADPEAADFANEHSLPAQRFYNLLCISYGADRKTFGDLVEKGYLPPARAEQCAAEYQQVAYAFQQLIAPHLKGRKPTATNTRVGIRHCCCRQQKGQDYRENCS